jgi:acetyltransferase
VTAADALEAHGLQLASLGAETRSALSAILVPAASLQNPVDMLAAASPQQYANCLRILLADPQVDSVMVILPPPPMHTAGGIAKAIIPVIYTAEKPVVVALMGERLIQEAVEHFRAAHVPDYRFPERAAVALAVLAQRFEYLASANAFAHAAAPASRKLAGLHRRAARKILAAQPAGSTLPSQEVFRLLEAYGISSMHTVLATNPSEAVQRALELGFPLAMKLASPDILHKSDVGGVLLNLAEPGEVARGYQSITENARRAHPEARIQGVHLQRMIPQGQEVIVGALQDAQFGALVMFGSGGVEVEGLKDVQFALAPLAETEAESLLDNTWAGQKLRGYRNFPPADRAAVLDALIRLAQLASDFPQLVEIEINPLLVLESGALAVDARARLAA